VLIHGRTLTAPVTFDTKYPAPGGTLSVQEALARAGIDTFAPSLLGYGESTTYKEGLDDPANASVRPFEGSNCPHPEGCDRTHNPVFGLDLQGSLLLSNPLDGQRQKHSSNVRFAGTDVWVRDIGQVIDDALAQAQPKDGKVTLIGYSLGAMRVGRLGCGQVSGHRREGQSGGVSFTVLLRSAKRSGTIRGGGTPNGLRHVPSESPRTFTVHRGRYACPRARGGLSRLRGRRQERSPVGAADD
jgi:pimeloyl-ACP methyl ester carboxylesterase